jgi:hypothetical protein
MGETVTETLEAWTSCPQSVTVGLNAWFQLDKNEIAESLNISTHMEHLLNAVQHCRRRAGRLR